MGCHFVFKETFQTRDRTLISCISCIAGGLFTTKLLGKPHTIYEYAKLFQSCPTLCYSMDCSPPGSSVHGILQARILEWAAMPSFRGSLKSPALPDGFFTTSTTWEAHSMYDCTPKMFQTFGDKFQMLRYHVSQSRNFVFNVIYRQLTESLPIRHFAGYSED